MDNNIISIKNVLESGLNEYVCLGDEIVISHIHDLSLFRYPCHLNALTILGCIGGEIKGMINLRRFQIVGRSLQVNYPNNIIQISETKNVHAFAIIISLHFLHNISFKASSFASFLVNENKYAENIKLSNSDFLDVVRYVNLLNDALLMNSKIDNRNVIEHLTMSFLANSEVLFKQYYANFEDCEQSCSKHIQIKFKRFIELVSQYHSEERELRFYADKMCITPKYLSIVVLNASGKRAADWINEFVILEAKSLLRYSGLNTQEISRKLHFSSQSAFGKFFKSKEGISPRDYLNDEMVP